MEVESMKHHTGTSTLGNAFRRTLTWYLMIAGILALLIGSTLGAVAITRAAPAPQPYLTLSQSVPQQIATYKLLGHHNPNAPLTIELALHPNNQAALDNLINVLYDRKSPQFHKWLPTGAFAAQFGLTSSQLAAVKGFLSQAGLHVAPGAPGAFLLRAVGTSGQVEAAFHTTINDYLAPDGSRYFANATAIGIPASLSGVIDGVAGLDNLVRAHTNYQRVPRAHPQYGGGPGGTGLTPSQIAGIYLANPLYALGDTGAGKTLGLFELSGYTASDIGTYCTQFSLTCPTLTDIPVDGGPGTDHSGAGEVELDIELQIALAPGVKGILVYNAPNTGTGLMDQYAKIASDNLADSISTSWGSCEANSISVIWDSEFTSFEQMAVQGQTIVAAAGDSGAFDCLHGGSSNGSNQVDDPASNPYMTGVGGTSLGSFDPGSNPNPVYPTTGESVWNNGCTSSSCSGGGGGGNSKIWAKPGYQAGAGVVNNYSKFSPWCSQPAGTQCREVPDVSMNADPFTPYSIYCTDPGDSSCGGFVGFGGTSCAAPLWAAIIALTDSRHSNRLGEASFVLYNYITTNGYHYQFHDVTTGNNGWFPARPNYDMASGIGTPKIYYLATTLP